MSAAPSWPLVIVALLGRAFQSAVSRPLPGFEFSSVFGSEAQFQGTQVLNSFFKPSKRKTTREALDRTRPSDRSHCGLQKPEIAYSPNDLRRLRRRRPAQSRFRAAAPIWGSNRGDSRVKSQNPHKFLCPVRSKAFLLQAPLRTEVAGGRITGPSLFSAKPSGELSLVRGSRSRNRWLLELDLRASLLEL